MRSTSDDFYPLFLPLIHQRTPPKLMCPGSEKWQEQRAWQPSGRPPLQYLMLSYIRELPHWLQIYSSVWSILLNEISKFLQTFFSLTQSVGKQKTLIRDQATKLVFQDIFNIYIDGWPYKYFSGFFPLIYKTYAC